MKRSEKGSKKFYMRAPMQMLTRPIRTLTLCSHQNAALMENKNLTPKQAMGNRKEDFQTLVVKYLWAVLLLLLYEIL